MTQIGKLFKKIPYSVRDVNNHYKDIRYIESLVKTLVSNENIEENNIINIFSNNRDSIFHFHIILREKTSENNLYFKNKGDDIEITFEGYKEPKGKTKKVNSFLFLETFEHLNEKALIEAFEGMIGCDGEKLFISIANENLFLFRPNSNHYKYRNTLLEKESVIRDTCISFDINCEKLFENLNPNLIKQVCKDLNLTYKRLASELGYKPDTINKAASTGKVSEQLKKAISLYLENIRLQEEMKKLDSMRQVLNNFIV